MRQPWSPYVWRAAALLLMGAVDLRAQDDTMARWVETRKLISREKQEWAIGREVLQDRIELLRREQESLTEKREKMEGDISETDAKLEALHQQNRELKAATAGLGDAIADLESRLLALLPRMPEPIRDRVRPLSQRIPSDPADTELSLSERFQNVVGVLNEMNKFSREIVIASEVRQLDAETSAEVSVMYLGMGQAYYGNLNGGIAGVGRPGTNGWVWTADNALVESVDFAIGVYRNEKPAEYRVLPVRVE